MAYRQHAPSRIFAFREFRFLVFQLHQSFGDGQEGRGICRRKAWAADEAIEQAISIACNEIMEGRVHNQFPVNGLAEIIRPSPLTTNLSIRLPLVG
jgi:hypothetical protein